MSGFRKFSEVVVGSYLAFYLIGFFSEDLVVKTIVEVMGTVFGVLFLTTVVHFYRRFIRKEKGAARLETTSAVELPEVVKTVPDLLIWGSASFVGFGLSALPILPASTICGGLYGYAQLGVTRRRKLVFLGLFAFFVGLVLAFIAYSNPSILTATKAATRLSFIALSFSLGTLIGDWLERGRFAAGTGV